MKKRNLGHNAPSVSAIGFGAMPLSISERPSEKQGIAVLQAALDCGMTVIDTADAYCLDDRDVGHNERLIAKALASWSGDRAALVVATKGGIVRPQGRWERNGDPQHLRAACERSLRALGVERIDLYQFHAPDPRVPLSDSVGCLADMRQEGKIRWLGLSNVSVKEIELARGITEVTSVQNRLSPFFREARQSGVINYCQDNGIGFLAYSPVGGGRLNKRLPGHPTLEPIAKRHGASAHAVVLAWVLAQAPNVIPIPGARTIEHARDSAGADDLVLTQAELQEIEAAEFSTL